MADESLLRSVEGQENGRHEESGQKPTFNLEEFGSEDAALENGDRAKWQR